MRDKDRPAFPQHVCEICSDPIGHMEPNYSGMTLRQYYAGQALAGLMANPVAIQHGGEAMGMAIHGVIDPQGICFSIADKMIAFELENPES